MSKQVKPRTVPDRDEKYMGLAFWAASFSKDPNTQVGAFIIDKNGHPLGWGYNGPPKQVDDDDMDWSRPKKYHMIVHAEANAIDHTLDRNRLKESTIYVTARPCKDCMLKIANAKIEKVVYFKYKSDKESSINDNQDLVEDIAEQCEIELEEFNGDLNWMMDRIEFMKNLGIFN